MDKNLQEAFLSLVRLGIDVNASFPSKAVEWTAMKALAERQGLSAIILDGIERLPEDQQPPQLMLLTWIGRVMQGYEGHYEAYRKAVVELTAFYNAQGFKMMLLKGLACGRDWTNPAHRPYGDIDIWLFGRQKEADRILASEMGINVDNSHHHHTVFNWMGFTVENHYDFVNVHAHKSSRELEKVFKELGQDDSHSVEVMGDASICSATKVYLPSPNLHALFLIKHMAAHFAAVGITLRQVLDWAFFVEKHSKEVDWEWLDGMLVKYHMREFVNCINAICVEDLGFHADIFPSMQIDPELKERVLNDILDPKYAAAEPQGFMNRMIYKYQRWQGNAWKQRLCYSESRWSSFWTGIWAKILKPASI